MWEGDSNHDDDEEDIRESAVIVPGINDAIFRDELEQPYLSFTLAQDDKWGVKELYIQDGYEEVFMI